jgi:inorganic pyrophosphatase
MNLLHELIPGPDIPNVICVVAEVPKRSRNRYEYDKNQGLVMLDRGVDEDKVLAVPAYDPIFQDYYDIPHIPQHLLAEMGLFFEVCKELERVPTEVLGWERAETAPQQILYAAELYWDRLDRSGPES